MSKYTTQLRFICETSAGQTESQGYTKVANIIKTAAPKIFDFDFPIFDENYRLPLETKILRHYYTQEICEETVGLWKLRLEDKLNLIMPYYNRLYESSLLEFNPFYDVDLTRDHNVQSKGESNIKGRMITTDKRNTIETQEQSTTDDRTIKSSTDKKDTTNGQTTNTDTTDTTNKTTQTDNGTNWTLFSDTPQGDIRDMDSIEGKMFLTTATKQTNDDKSVTDETGNIKNNGKTSVETIVSGEETNNVADNNTRTLNDDKTIEFSEDIENNENRTNNINNTEDYIEHVKGKQGGASYSKLLQEFRETFLNIDALIIAELSDLFFGLWN